MSPRPPLPPGTHGKVTVTGTPGSYEAKARVRDWDGVTRQVRRTGLTKQKAENALKAAVRDRHRAGGEPLTRDSRIDALAEQWLADDHPWSTGTRQVYESVVKNQITPALGQLRISEARVPVLDRALRDIGRRHGRSAAKSTKSVLSGMFKLAVRHEVLDANPMRDTSPVSVTTKRARALTVPETERLTDLLRSSPLAVHYDIPDLVEWMLGTGCRIGEALALRTGVNSEGEPLLDLEVGTWEVNATIKRVKARGLVIQPRAKTDAGWRRLALPLVAVDIIRRRVAEARLPAPDGVVFGSPHAKSLRDPNNAEGDLRRVLDSLECDTCRGTGYRLNEPGELDSGFALTVKGHKQACNDGPWSWVTSHTFRKTVATRLNEAGLTPDQVADHLGHKDPSVTMNVYFGRQVTVREAAAILNR